MLQVYSEGLCFVWGSLSDVQLTLQRTWLSVSYRGYVFQNFFSHEEITSR